MRITAAVLHDVDKPHSVETVELDPPRCGEVLVKVGAAGVCRSDLHFQITRRYPLADINRAYEDLDTDAVGRGVIVF